MKFAQLIVSLALIALLVWHNQVFGGADAAVYGGLSWAGWASILLAVIGIVHGADRFVAERS